MAKATLWGPDGQHEIVDVGSARATELSKQHWQLSKDKASTVFSSVGSDSLSGTLPADQSLKPVQTEAGSPIGGLDALRQVMKTVSDRASAEAMKSGATNAFKGFEALGASPEKVSGNFVADIINFVEKSTQPTIQDEFTQMTSLIDNIEKYQKDLRDRNDQITANSQSIIDKSVANGMWQKMSDAQRQKLWTSAGYIGKPIVTQDISFQQFEDARGHIWNVGIDSRTGAVVRKDDLGLMGTPSKGPADTAEEDRLKTIAAFKADLVNPKGVGIDKGIAIHGEDVPAAQGSTKNKQGNPISDYVTRETLISKLQAKWGYLIAPEDIAQQVYDTYHE